MWGPHSLLAMCVSAGRQDFDLDLVPRKSPPKNQHVGNFQTTENELVDIHSSPGEDVIWDTEEIQIPK